MAFSNYNSEEIFISSFFPYFTWFALFGLITLILCMIFKVKFAPLSIKYPHIAIFILLLSPQYIFLFDSIGGDLNLDIQQRYILIILPAMSFLGALFLWQTFMLSKNLVNPKILIILVQTIILANTISHGESFKKNLIHRNNASLQEYYQIQKWASKIETSSIFFTRTPMLFLERGFSAFSYDLLVDVEETALDELLKTYNGNVFVVETSTCKFSHSIQKMLSDETTRVCDRVVSYFDVDTVLNVNLVENTRKTLLIYKILGLNEKDKKGLLRIFDKLEPTEEAVSLVFKIPRDTSAAWKIQHFLNDEYLHDSPYKKGYFIDSLKFTQFTRDTNIWRLDIVDTATNEKIHSDFWQLVKTGR
jgi:hypothetical protein